MNYSKPFSVSHLTPVLTTHPPTNCFSVFHGKCLGELHEAFLKMLANFVPESEVTAVREQWSESHRGTTETSSSEVWVQTMPLKSSLLRILLHVVSGWALSATDGGRMLIPLVSMFDPTTQPSFITILT